MVTLRLRVRRKWLQMQCHCLGAAAGIIIIIETALTREREAAKSIAIGVETVDGGSNPIERP